MENNESKKQFENDLKANRPAEYLAAELMHIMFPRCKVKFVGDDSKYYHYGDLVVIKPNGKKIYIDVKNDGRWRDTGNLNAEDELWKRSYEMRWGLGKVNGFMRCANYNAVIYLDVYEKQFLFINFEKWKAVYNKEGYYTTESGSKRWYDSKGRKVMPHPFNSRNPYEITYGYLNPIDKMIDAGVVIGRVYFDYDGSINDYENLHIVEKIDYSKNAA